jgi:hypothetical protein
MLPPVNIANTNAGVASFSMLYGAAIYAAGAGGYGHKLICNRPVPLALSLSQHGPRANPNSPSSRFAAIPMNRLRRKQGYPAPGAA